MLTPESYAWTDRARPTAMQLWINATIDNVRLCHKQLWTPV
jgi:hypothetical protein